MFLSAFRQLVQQLSRRGKRPRHRARAGAVRPQVEALEGRTLPSIVTWRLTSGGDWNTAANWDLRVPTASDDAVIGEFHVQSGAAVVQFDAHGIFGP